MQDGAAHTESVSFRKRRLGGNAAIDEANAMEGLARRPVPRDPETAQCGQAIGHQSFAAGFVDGRACTVGKGDSEAFAARGDGGCEAGGTASDYEYVS
jgi:hypothetical protein